MNIKWKIHDHDKTWIENSSEDINIVETIEGEDGYEKTYVIQGNLKNPGLIRKQDANYVWQPDEVDFCRRTLYVTKWKKVNGND